MNYKEYLQSWIEVERCLHYMHQEDFVFYMRLIKKLQVYHPRDLAMKECIEEGFWSDPDGR